MSESFDWWITTSCSYKIKKYGPVVKLQLGQAITVVISSPQAAKEVLKTREISFAQRPGFYAIENTVCNYHSRSETLSTTIELATAELLKSLRIMKKIQEEVRKVCKGKSKIEETDIQKLENLNLVVKETFRLHPPVTLIPRIAMERCEINGYIIPTDTKILTNPYAIGRDSIIWTNPECFQPERFEDSSIDFKGNNFELLPFDSGRRICPGISFAIASIAFALSQLLYHFDGKLVGGIKLEDLDMNENFAITSRITNNLNVIAITSFPFQK